MATKVPSWLPEKWHDDWRKPWTVKAGKLYRRGFKRALRKHGYLSPHFTKADAKCHDGTPVPKSMVLDAQHHAFMNEKLRHAVGDRPLPVLSWYRTPAYNAQIGGASQSQHMRAVATDFSVQLVTAIGTAKFDGAANRIFSKGGFGQYPGGSRHTDSRGYYARWTSF